MRSQLWWRAWCASKEQEQMLSSPITLSKPLNGWKKTVLSKHLILLIASKFIKLFLIWETIFIFQIFFWDDSYSGWVDEQSSTVQSNVLRYSKCNTLQYSKVVHNCRRIHIISIRDRGRGKKWKGRGRVWNAFYGFAEERGKNLNGGRERIEQSDTLTLDRSSHIWSNN